MDFIRELKARAALVDRALEEYLPTDGTHPAVIHEAMRYSLFAGGKRLRPVLALSASEVAGGSVEKIMPAACALELIHTYSLIHDDLPAMDDDDFRRGRPTCHKKYGEAMAILAGDALLTMAFELLTSGALTGALPARESLAVISEVAVAAGSRGLVGGQVVDIISDDSVDPATLEYIHRHKTGALYRGSVRLGAILSGAERHTLDRLTVYAEHLGLAFQIADDILDVTGDEEKIGKPLKSDVKNKKATYPALYGLAAARAKAYDCRDRALTQLEAFGPEADFLRELVRFVVDRDH
ncbi:MAG: geranyl transferase [Peptococcaceae bacterium BRH_c4b]|nr:MAG: geranyl transferase [Peptococcaceae bacterium BRH_c4b]